MLQSGADIRIVPASPAHIRTIAKRMREADRIEVWASSRKTPGEALVWSLRKSTFAWTALIDGRPEVMFGVGDLNVLGGVGAPWLLGTDAVETHFVSFLRLSVEFRRQLLRRYSVLRNFVHDGNRASIRWLRWLGFTLSDPVTIGDQAFRMFELRAGDV
jgi:hypothetical protein